MAYLKNKHLANIKKWNLDLSKYKDGVYHDHIYVPYDIKEFRGFKETFGFDINVIGGSLDFEGCKYLTTLPNLPEIIEGFLYLDGCTSLTFIEKMPSVVKDRIYTDECPFFENLTEKEIREKWNVARLYQIVL